VPRSNDLKVCKSNRANELGEESVSEAADTLWGLQSIWRLRGEPPFWGIPPKRGASFWT